MAKVTLAEIVSKWEVQKDQLASMIKSHENRYPYGTTNPSQNEVKLYHRNEARLEMITEHIRELQQYALAHAR